jgi:hypothetical protein
MKVKRDFIHPLSFTIADMCRVIETSIFTDFRDFNTEYCCTVPCSRNMFVLRSLGALDLSSKLRKILSGDFHCVCKVSSDFMSLLVALIPVTILSQI